MDVSEKDFSDILNLNLKSQFLCARAVVPYLKQQKYGKIVNIVSDAGRFRSYMAGLPYVAAKAGVHGQTRLLARELGPYNVTVNAVSPGNVLTEQGREDLTNNPALRVTLKDCPMGRWTEPEELASVVLFFASDLSSHVTGVTMSANGGWHMVW